MFVYLSGYNNEQLMAVYLAIFYNNFVIYFFNPSFLGKKVQNFGQSLIFLLSVWEGSASGSGETELMLFLLSF